MKLFEVTILLWYFTYMKQKIKRLFLRKNARIFSAKNFTKNAFLVVLALCFFSAGILFVWTATIKIPDLNSLEDWKMVQSTKIYDRTGKVLLYDVHGNIKRTIVPLDQVSTTTRNAAIAIEDSRFYEHYGIDVRSIFRAIFVNIGTGGFSQGGSTITQQVVKNAFLSPEKTITRKLKEWVMALKMEQILSKDKILELYFNEVPYGGSIYGIEEASLSFFGKHTSDLSLSESAYLAALPQAPTYYSPYGNNRDKLEERKNLVLKRMLELGFIGNSDYTKAVNEKAVFLPPQEEGITAPHFVMMVKQYLEEKYGKDMLENGGLKIVTTLDASLQVKAEEVAKKYGEDNVKQFNAHNAAMVAADPKTGQILVMVGSRDYFNKDIDGNFNVALSPNRQPGSSFKPFVYATAFMKGYTPETVLFDLKTEFNSSCSPDGVPTLPGMNPDECYMPENYDYVYRGPMTLRDALAQSINVVAVKTFYLAGIPDSVETAKKMGLTTIKNPKQYGLTLVLGSGEVSLYEMTGAYGVFANNGEKNPNAFILRVEDEKGKTLEEFKKESEQVIDKDIALQISDILSDNDARAPAFGSNSFLNFANRSVAVKTGTTNNYRDAWIIGYTPSFVLGTWVGNNDNTPMEKKVAGFIVAPMWHAVMEEALKKLPVENFEAPAPIPSDIKPILRGAWMGNESYFIDRTSGQIATDLTPTELRIEQFVPNTHSILYWVNKDDPRGPIPANPEKDSQFINWETPIRQWVEKNGINQKSLTPTVSDNIHTAENKPKVFITSFASGATYHSAEKIQVTFTSVGKFPAQKADFFINGNFIGTTKTAPFDFSFIPNQVKGSQAENELKVVVIDTVQNTGEASVRFNVTQ
jgi:1A family penicillin-binding protein